MKMLVENRKAYFNYEILETFEAGMELIGLEVKAIKEGKANLSGAFALVRDGEVWLTNVDIQPYQPNNTPKDYDPKRTRRLLLKKEEIDYLTGKLKTAGLTLMPLKLYNKDGLIKLELGLARGKKKYDKRETIKKRETKREIERTLKA